MCEGCNREIETKLIVYHYSFSGRLSHVYQVCHYCVAQAIDIGVVSGVSELTELDFNWLYK